MSLIYGSFRPGGSQPQAEEDVRKMTAAARLYGNTGHQTHGARGLCLAQMERAPSDGSSSPLSPALPLQNEPEDLTVLLDGRLDDRRELARSLGFEEMPGRGPRPDAHLLLEAYRRWGTACAERIHGETAWALWDGRRRRLLVSRDLFGLRPLYHSWDGKRLLFASQLAQVAAAAELGEGDVDEGFLSDFLIAGKGFRGATPWKGVESLTPAHLLTLEDGEVRSRPCGELEDGEPLRLGSSQEYAERFRELFQQAVAQRMPAGETIWSDLSGGLDSSSVVSVAAQEIATREREGRDPGARDRFRTLHWENPQSPESDEWKWAKAVMDHHRVEGFRLDGHDLPYFHDARQGARYWDLPSLEVMGFAHHRKMADLLSEHRVDGLLKGLGAESVVLYECMPPLHLPDLLKSFRLGAFFRDLLAWQKHYKEPLLPLAWRYGLRPLVDPGSMTYRAQEGIPEWIDPAFAERNDMSRRAFRAWMPRRFRRAADQWQYEQIGRTAGSLHAGLFHKVTDVRLPFLYRPLVEFSLRVPWEEKIALGEDKILLKRAMKGILPPKIQKRRKIVTGNAAVHLGIQRARSEIDSILDEGRLDRWGFLDGQGHRRALKLAYQGDWSYLPGLLRPVALEAWLAAHLGDRSGAVAEAA